MEKDIEFMKLALEQAKIAYKKDEVPIGAVIVCNDKVIAKGFNIREKRNDPTGHAEIVAIKKACKKRRSWRLEDCTIYVTVEPCSMCAGALLWTRIKRIVFGAFDAKGGALGSSYNLFEQKNLNHKAEITSGVLEKECISILSNFFKEKRIEKQNIDKDNI